METRTYRQNGCVMCPGVLFGIVGLVILAIAIYHLATGIPLWQSDGKLAHGGSHIATQNELIFFIVGGTPLFLFGVFILVYARNSVVIIDEERIRQTNAFRRTTFQAAWPEITAFTRQSNQPGAGYTLEANGKKLAINSSMTGFKDLAAEIHRRAPNLSGK